MQHPKTMRLRKPIFWSLGLSFILVTSGSYAQYYHHGTYPNLCITSDFFGYWAKNYSVGSHGHGFRLYRIDNWESTLILNIVGDFGGYQTFLPFFLNDSTGFIMSHHLEAMMLSVLGTQDYGTNWEVKLNGSPWHCRIFFTDPSTGFLSHCPGPVSIISGYGNVHSWDTTQFWIDGSILYFINDSIGFVSGHGGDWNHYLLRTIDRGMTWKVNFCDSGFFFNFFSDLRFRSPDSGILVTDGGGIKITFDGGDSWKEANAPSASGLNCVRYYNDKDVIIVGDGGTTLRSYDGGKNWEEEINNLNTDLTLVTITETRTFIQDKDWNLYSDKAIGTVEHKAGRLQLWPNPVTGMLRISGYNARASTITIHDIAGHQVLKTEFSALLDTERLTRGLYFITVESPDSTPVSGKFIKR